MWNFCVGSSSKEGERGRQMRKTKRLILALTGLILGMYAFSYKMYAAESNYLTTEGNTWDIQSSLDISDCVQGETVNLSVYLKGSEAFGQQDIMMMSGILEYDNNLLTVEKADLLPAEDSKVQSLSFDASTGMFCVEYHSATSVQDGSLLMKIQLHVAANASAETTAVCITNMEWGSSDSQQIMEVEHCVPLQLTIAKPGTIATDTVDKADTDSVIGDVNLDGRTDLSDAKLIMQYYNGEKSFNSQQKKNADVNGDGRINLIDVKMIMKYYNGEISKF